MDEYEIDNLEDSSDDTSNREKKSKRSTQIERLRKIAEAERQAKNEAIKIANSRALELAKILEERDHWALKATQSQEEYVDVVENLMLDKKSLVEAEGDYSQSKLLEERLATLKDIRKNTTKQMAKVEEVIEQNKNLQPNLLELDNRPIPSPHDLEKVDLYRNFLSQHSFLDPNSPDFDEDKYVEANNLSKELESEYKSSGKSSLINSKTFLNELSQKMNYGDDDGEMMSERNTNLNNKRNSSFSPSLSGGKESKNTRYTLTEKEKDYLEFAKQQIPDLNVDLAIQEIVRSRKG